jgi:hypothetical protein
MVTRTPYTWQYTKHHCASVIEAVDSSLNISLHSQILMVTRCADRAMHAVAADSTHFAARRIYQQSLCRQTSIVSWILLKDILETRFLNAYNTGCWKRIVNMQSGANCSQTNKYYKIYFYVTKKKIPYPRRHAVSCFSSDITSPLRPSSGSRTKNNQRVVAARNRGMSRNLNSGTRSRTKRKPVCSWEEGWARAASRINATLLSSVSRHTNFIEFPSTAFFPISRPAFKNAKWSPLHRFLLLFLRSFPSFHLNNDVIEFGNVLCCFPFVLFCLEQFRIYEKEKNNKSRKTSLLLPPYLFSSYLYPPCLFTINYQVF